MRYNGHRSWQAWNVSLWINNDEGLYRLAKDCIRETSNKSDAAHHMLTALRDAGVIETQDGARFTVSTIRAAMVGM